jgi:hypothetical protein
MIVEKNTFCYQVALQEKQIALIVHVFASFLNTSPPAVHQLHDAIASIFLFVLSTSFALYTAPPAQYESVLHRVHFSGMKISV